ncbi:hypothetical protein M8C21_032928 [Ambrosia artemisiifolia]|uniref:Uncharacterized protein n=1 Tax=Ambrosia artemisiifolia TaxID=4212 RepID=A0AAD5GCV9_AMBAR|nr:hypothetical protein M8C21_032928 [Ambrosia artemisiifolia]
MVYKLHMHLFIVYLCGWFHSTYRPLCSHPSLTPLFYHLPFSLWF